MNKPNNVGEMVFNSRSYSNIIILQKEMKNYWKW